MLPTREGKQADTQQLPADITHRSPGWGLLGGLHCIQHQTGAAKLDLQSTTLARLTEGRVVAGHIRLQVPLEALEPGFRIPECGGGQAGLQVCR